MKKQLLFGSFRALLITLSAMCIGQLNAQTITATTTPTCSNDGTITVSIPSSFALSAVRYVRIQQNKNDYLHIAELRAIEVGTGTNVALNKTVTSQSNWPGLPPSNLVDDDVNTLGHSENSGTQEYLEVDLGATYLLDRVEIINRGDCCQDRADNLLLILKSASGTTVNSRQIDAYQSQNSGYTSTWNVTDVSWTDGATTLNRTGLSVGNYTINYSDIGGTTAQETFAVNSLPSPTLFNVSGDNGFSCNGTGVAVGLSNSETGVNYQLKRGATDVGSPVPGTGAAISFGNQTVSGTYTVVATHATSSCVKTMTGSATITIESSNLTPSVTIVSNDADNSIIINTSVTFTATPTNGGTPPTYQWKKNGNNVGTNSTTYTDAALANGDVISCVMTSTNPCASPTTGTSNSITMTVIDPCAGISGRLYVKANGTGNGSSWANATSDLQAAIDNTCGITEIWVAAGTYKPAAYPTGCSGCASSRDYAFSIKDGISLYGGFAGTETLLSQRNIAANPTILSGDIGTLNDNTDNCHHVIIAISPNSGATGMTFDGFTITGGNGNVFGSITVDGYTINKQYGGGMHAANKGAATHNFVNNTFMNNNTVTWGGGLYASQEANSTNSITRVTNNVFKNNSSNSFGGGLSTVSNSSSGITYVSNNVFSNNSTVYNGGGAHSYFYVFMGVSGTQYYTNNTFYENSVSSTSGGGGGLSVSSAPFTGKTGVSYCHNNIFWANLLNGQGNVADADIYIRTVQITTYVVTHCLTQANSTYASGTGIINNQNPLFTNAASNDFTLQSGSPCINAGDNTAWTATGLTTDMAGNTRPNGVVDMGAYESQTVLPVEFIAFNGRNTEGGNLLTWTTANEQNNKGFWIERQPTAGNGWQTLGFVAAQSKAATYTFTDIAPLPTSYYRLRQIDNDSKETLSKIIAISAKAPQSLKIYPNVVKDFLTVETNNTADFVIVNLLGQEVMRGKTAQQIAVSTLPKGVYLFRMGSEVAKFVKE